jgi:peptidoglycan lytic transglycosylase
MKTFALAVRRARRWTGGCALVGAALSLAACASARLSPSASGPGRGAIPATMRPYEVDGHWYRPAEQPHYRAVGYASWYGEGYGCEVTADGEAMDPRAITGAHRTLPLPSVVEVTNLDNGRRLRVRINDRGPFVGDRLVDLSPAAAKALGFYREGVARVRVRYVGRARPTALADQIDRSAPTGRCR